MKPLQRIPFVCLFLSLWVSACNPATTRVADDVKQGEAIFMQSGCTNCHATTSEMRVGPGLLGVLSGPTGNALPNGEPKTETNVAAWIREKAAASNGLMPVYPALNDDEMQSLMAYLKSLQ